jgi:hypothetical protein
MSACAVSMRWPSWKDGERNNRGWNREKRMKGIEEKKGNEGLTYERIDPFPLETWTFPEKKQENREHK